MSILTAPPSIEEPLGRIDDDPALARIDLDHDLADHGNETSPRIRLQLEEILHVAGDDCGHPPDLGSGRIEDVAVDQVALPVLALLQLARLVAGYEQRPADGFRLLAGADAFELDEEPVAVRPRVLDD